MTKRDYESTIMAKLKEVWKLYREYNPDGNGIYLSASDIKKESYSYMGDVYFSVTSSYHDEEDKQLQRSVFEFENDKEDVNETN